MSGHFKIRLRGEFWERRKYFYHCWLFYTCGSLWLRTVYKEASRSLTQTVFYGPLCKRAFWIFYQLQNDIFLLFVIFVTAVYWYQLLLKCEVFRGWQHALPLLKKNESLLNRAKMRLLNEFRNLFLAHRCRFSA